MFNFLLTYFNNWVNLESSSNKTYNFATSKIFQNLVFKFGSLSLLVLESALQNFLKYDSFVSVLKSPS